MSGLIQTLDLDDYLHSSDERRAYFVAKVREILSDTGFFFLKNHDIPDQLITEYARVSKLFFNLPVDTKNVYEYAHLHHQVGWSPLGLEKGEYASRPDLKEFFQVGDIYPYPYIKEIPEFALAAQMLFGSFRTTFQVVLRAIAESLDLPAAYFDDKEGNSIMRSILYPADPHPPSEDAEVEGETAGGNALGMCSSRHTDIDMVTLLFARKPGLQLKYKGKYEPVTTPDPDLIIVNAGDMLEHLTGGKYVSGTHRVVCEPNIARWSVPFFGHVLPQTSIVPLYSNADREKYPYSTADEFLMARLAQIGLTAH